MATWTPDAHPPRFVIECPGRSSGSPIEAIVDVSVIIVSYNTAGLTEACLASLFEETDGIAFEVLLVDNDSSDDSAERVRHRFPQVRLTALSENVGFARAVNLAADQAKGDYFLLLNPDTLVHDGAVQRIVAFARSHPSHGIYGGRTLSPSGRLDPRSCWGRPSPWSLFCFALGLRNAFERSPLFDPESLGRWERDSVREVAVVTGCLCLIERSVWRELGGFDERFFMYGEDTDLCLRALERGWRPVITPDATVTHVVGASTARRADKKLLVMRAKSTLVRRHFSAGTVHLGLFLLGTGAALRALGSRIRRESAGLDTWREVWARREDWLGGYRDAESGPASGASATES